VIDDLETRWADLGAFIRGQREQVQLSVRRLAEMAGVSNPYLSQIERGLRRPSADILQQIAKGLSISAETLYVRAGMLDPEIRPHRTVIDAVNTDPLLTADQRSTLLKIYESFCAQNGPPPDPPDDAADAERAVTATDRGSGPGRESSGARQR
jgi:transcriptional regulator with XRE-family HTH domain